MALIEVQDVRKHFGSGDNRVEALKGIDLTIKAGEMVAIIGPSGCGKTTLLNCMSGIDRLTSGEVRLDGKSIYQMKESELDRFRAKEMGFVFQSYNLIPVLSAVENVEIPLLCIGMKAKQARIMAEDALSRVGLKERKHHLPSELSGGQQQRVALARAIVNNPKVIWADEPTGALDRKTTEMVLDLIDHLNRVEGITFVIVTHDPKVAEHMHRVLYIDSGEVVQERVTRRGQKEVLT